MKQEVSRISAEKDGVFFVRIMTDASVMIRTAIETPYVKGIIDPCDAYFNTEIS